MAVIDDLPVELHKKSVFSRENSRSHVRHQPDHKPDDRTVIFAVHGARILADDPAERPDEILHRRRDDGLELGVLRQVLHPLPHKPDNEGHVELAHPPAGRRQRIERRQAVRQVRQHADERHDVFARRILRKPEANSRGARIGQRRGKLGEVALRPAAESDATAERG